MLMLLSSRMMSSTGRKIISIMISRNRLPSGDGVGRILRSLAVDCLMGMANGGIMSLLGWRFLYVLSRCLDCTY